MNAEPATNSRKISYTKKFETINIAAAAALADSGRYDHATFRGHPVNDVLRSFIKRAVPDSSGMFGCIEVWWWESVNHLKVRGRRYSGFKGSPTSGAPGPREAKVARNLQCISAFALPKELREALRIGVDGRDMDISVSHILAFARRHGIPTGPDGGAIGTFLADIDGHKDDLKKSPIAAEHGDLAVRLPIRVMNGYPCPPSESVPDWFPAMAAQFAEHHVKDARAPEVKLFNDRKRPAHSYGYFLNEAEERKLLDELEELVEQTGSQVVSYEHDGLFVSGSGDVEALAAKRGIPVQEKVHPKTLEEWTKKWGGEATAAVPAPTAELVHEVMGNYLYRALDSLEGEKIIDHDAWAHVMLECFCHRADFPEYVKNREDAENLVIEHWDSAGLRWIPAGGGRAMKDNAASALRRFVRQHAPHKDLGALPGNAPFMNPIIEAVKAKLPCATQPEIGMLNGDQTRGLLRFNDGLVVDFRTGTIIKCKPQDRIGFTTKVPWCPFERDGTALILAFIEAFMAFVFSGGQSVRGTNLEKMLAELRAAMPHGLFAVFWAIFEDDDVTVWIIRQVCRGCAGLELLEEFLLFFDERGKNGKGTILNLLRLALGEYYCTCPYKGALADTGGSGNNDKLAKCQGKRVVSCNEAFGMADKSTQFEPRTIKTLIGLDDPVETMQKYKAPLEWRGQALLILCTNLLPMMPDDDGGLMSRISLVRFPFEFIPRPTTEEHEDIPDRPEQPGARWQDPSIKLTHMQTLVPEFFHWAIHFNRGLLQQKLTGRVLTPRPSKIEAETEELFRKGSLVAPAGEEDASLLHQLRDFEALCLAEVPEDTNSQKGGTPATCGQVAARFEEFVRNKGVATNMDDVKNLLRRVYVTSLPVPPSKSFRVNKTSIRSFYRKVDHGNKKQFKTALMFKGVIAQRLGAESGAA